MHHSIKALFTLVLAGSALVGCNRGYMTASDLESAERGPKACSASCDELGMRMSAFVLVDRAAAGCVCSPNDQVSRTEEDAAGVVGGHVVLEEQRRQREQQQQQQRQASASSMNR